MRAIAILAMILGGLNTAMAEIHTEDISYASGGVNMKGFLAWDDSVTGQRPGIIVVHEWWGQTDYPRTRARMLAELGYTALALDMYGDGRIAEHPQDAGAFMNEVIENLEEGRARFETALALLKEHDTVDASRLGAIGYCFGGGVVLHMARMNIGLDVVASFHGSLGLASAPGPEQIETRVVAYNGQADPFVSPEALDGFRAVMEGAGADYQLVQLPGAIHGFSNPAATAKGEKFGLPLKYNKLADEASWVHMRLLFEDVFAENHQVQP